jgi:chromosomal replication initiation ATPase DnaA
MPKAVLNEWVKPARAISFEDNVLTLQTVSSYQREWLQVRIGEHLRRLVAGIAGHAVEIRYVE